MTARPPGEEGLFPALLLARCSSPGRSHQRQDLPSFSSHLPSPGHSMLLHPLLPQVALVLPAACLILLSSSSSFSPTQTCCLRDCTRASLASFGGGWGGKDSAKVHPLARMPLPISQRLVNADSIHGPDGIPNRGSICKIPGHLGFCASSWFCGTCL